VSYCVTPASPGSKMHVGLSRRGLVELSILKSLQCQRTQIATIIQDDLKKDRHQGPVFRLHSEHVLVEVSILN